MVVADDLLYNGVFTVAKGAARAAFFRDCQHRTI